MRSLDLVDSLPQRAVRSILAGCAALLLAAVTAGCGAGFNAQTNQQYQAAEGGNADSGSIGARNFLVLANDAGRGVLHGVLVNSGDTDDRLASIEAEMAAEWRDPSQVAEPDPANRVGEAAQT